jgi:hypothetical protein
MNPQDLSFIALTLAFFVLSAVYAALCERFR